MDAAGIVVRRFAVRSPVRVDAGADGGLLVVSAVDGFRGGRYCALQLDADLRVTFRREVAGPGPGVGAAPADLIAAAQENDVVALARTPADSTRWWLLRRTPGRTARVRTRPPVDHDVRPSLAKSRLERWVRTTRGWERAFLFELPWSSRCVAVGRCRGQAGAWVAADRQGSVSFYSDRGIRTFAGAWPDFDGADALVSAGRSGGVWLGSGGALVRVDASGRRRPGQGGLGYVVDLCRAASRREPAVDVRLP